MSTATAPRTPARPAPVRPAYRFELVKLVSQWRTLLLLAACWLAPAAFVVGVSEQSSLPSDTVFGRWMNQTGWAGSLVVLAFACQWALPLVTSLVAGDVFAAEDRLGTWRHLMVAVRSPRRIFLAKAAASLTVILVMVAGLAVSSVAGGLVAVGDEPLVGLDGHLLSTGDTAVTVLVAWLCVLAPTLAFAAVGLLGSVALGRSPMGLVTPALLALLLQLVQLLPLPVSVRVALPSSAFLGWRGLFTDPAQSGQLLSGVAIALAWAVVAAALAYRLFLRRDFTDMTYDGSGRRVLVAGLAPLAALFAVTAGIAAVATPASGSGITQAKVQASLATAYAHLYRVQFRELHRPAVTEAQLRASAACDKGGSLVEDEGPGNDWRCVVTWHLPGATGTGTATYQLDVLPDGQYVADGDGPKDVNGYFVVHTNSGDVPNPLWQIDGLVDLPATAQKG